MNDFALAMMEKKTCACSRAVEYLSLLVRWREQRPYILESTLERCAVLCRWSTSCDACVNSAVQAGGVSGCDGARREAGEGRREDGGVPQGAERDVHGRALPLHVRRQHARSPEEVRTTAETWVPVPWSC